MRRAAKRAGGTGTVTSASGPRCRREGISTESVWEQVEEGVDLDEVAETFQLTVPDVRWALAYENATRAA